MTEHFTRASTPPTVQPSLAVEPVSSGPGSAPGKAPEGVGAMRDRHGRTFTYLRVAVTERCNLRCVYCMPEEGLPFAPREDLLSNDEIVRILQIGARLGISKVRFTGGEPLVRPEFVELVAASRAIPGLERVHMTTNGMLLERHLGALERAGLTGVNISIDTLRPERFRELTRRGDVETVLSAMHAAVRSSISTVKINVVAMRGWNDEEIPAFAELTRALPVTVRFIELMPFDAHQVWKRGRFLGAHRILEALHEHIPGLEPVEGSATEGTTLRAPGYRGKIAVIPSFSRTICATCNRVRLTADGRIRNCLYSDDEVNIRALLRGGGSDDELAAMVRGAMHRKPIDGWAAQREEKSELEKQRGSMTQIGG